jgi:hypothetical protein
VVVLPGIRARLYRNETVAAQVVGQAPAGTGEVGVERRGVLVHRVVVTPRSVGLPDLNELVADRPPCGVKDLPGDDNPLAQRFAGEAGSEVRVLGTHA